MNFTQLKSIIPALLMSDDDNERPVSIELISPPGRGKSDFARDLISLMTAKTGEEWGHAELFLGTQTPSDLVGYFFKGYIKGPNNEDVAITEATLPKWMLTTKGKPAWMYKHGVLILEEFGQGEVDVKRAAAELLLHGGCGGHQLPPGWVVIATSNRASDRSGVTKSLDFVINRRCEIHITDDLASWERWAFEKNVDSLFISFAAANPQIVFSDGVPEKQGPWCTPRSLVRLHDMMRRLKDDTGKLRTDDLVVELAAGMIGQAAAAQLFTHIRLGHEMPQLEDIIKDPKGVKVPQKPDACILVTYNLAQRVDGSNAVPVLTYMKRLPKEFGVTFAKTACTRNPKLVFSDAFVDWANSNSSLMTALAELK